MPTVEDYQRQLGTYGALQHLLGSMKVVAAVRWQQVRRDFAEAEAYARGIREALALIGSPAPCEPGHAPTGAPGIVLITSDEGLVGGFNQPLFDRLKAVCRESGGTAEVVALGERGRQFLHREGIRTLYERGRLRPKEGEGVDLLDVCETLIAAMADGRIRDVTVLYNHFHGFSQYEPVMRRVFPLDVPPPDDTDDRLLGTPPDQIRRHLLLEGLRADLYMALRQSMASEQSARLRTITGASDRLQAMVEETTRTYHQARQERITEELIELTAPLAIE